jgi:hypothetical protein
VKVAAEPTDAAVERMDVRVLEAWNEQAAVEGDDPRPRPDPRRDIALAADGEDPAGLDGDRFSPRTSRIDRVDVAAPEDEFGGGVCHRRTMAHRRATAAGDPSGATGPNRR